MGWQQAAPAMGIHACLVKSEDHDRTEDRDKHAIDDSREPLARD